MPDEMFMNISLWTERFRRACETFAEAVMLATMATAHLQRPLEQFNELYVDLDRSIWAYERAAKLVASRYNASHRYRKISWRRLNRPMRLKALRLAEKDVARS